MYFGLENILLEKINAVRKDILNGIPPRSTHVNHVVVSIGMMVYLEQRLNLPSLQKMQN